MGEIKSEIKPFAIVSKKLAADKDLKATAKSVYLSLCSFMNTDTRSCYPSRKAIRDRAKVSETTLSNALKSLEESGYIEIEERYVKDYEGNFTGERTSNNYIIKNV